MHMFSRRPGRFVLLVTAALLAITACTTSTDPTAAVRAEVTATPGPTEVIEDGTLDTQTATLVETHFEACPTCPPLCAAFVDASDRLSTLRDDDAVGPPDLEAAIHARLSGTSPVSSVVDQQKATD